MVIGLEQGHRAMGARVARSALPATMRHWLRARLRPETVWPAPGQVRFGSLRRVTPISRHWGWDRGTPVDRYYIERFLAAHAADVRGHALEVADDAYTRRFGGDRVERRDVLHAVEGNPQATLVADLTRADHLPSDAHDCIILTQVLQFIADPAAAVRTVHRILRPGGVVLVTTAGISKVSRRDMDAWGDYWRFTTLSARRLFESVFPAPCVEVQAHGNVLAATAFLQGLAASELRAAELDYHDPDFELLITVRATKPASGIDAGKDGDGAR